MTLLHLCSSHQPIIGLLTPHLPYSLSTLQPLTTPGSPLTLYSTLDPTSTAASDDDGWIVLVDLGNQLRFYHSFEKRILGEPNDGAGTGQKKELIEKGEELVERVIRDFLTNHQEGREVMKIGSISDVWSKAIERATGIPAEGETRPPRYRIWFDPSIRDTTGRPSPEKGDVEVDRTAAPEGMEFREAKEEDIAIFLSTSEVAHSPSYLSSRLPYTSVLISSSSRTIISHATTHRDGSLGTLFVSPSHRRKGLAKLVSQHRLSEQARESDGRGGRGHSHVRRDNESSRACMRSLGWEESTWSVWWGIIGIDEWRERERQKDGY
ncbi:hypothetical protein JCM5353_001248 [Sporobolomyces roseus]